MSRIPYTPEDDEIIKQFYPTEGSFGVSERLNRKPESVKQRARKLGVRKIRDHYSPDEEQIIRDYYPEWGVEKCMELLPNRSRFSIHKKAQIMNVKCKLITQRQNLGLRAHDMPKGFYMHSSGYWVFCPTGETEDRILYHRYVMEQHLGRKLSPDEIVHHKDGNKLNNDISNLEITNRTDHFYIHLDELKEHRRKARNKRKQ